MLFCRDVPHYISIYCYLLAVSKRPSSNGSSREHNVEKRKEIERERHRLEAFKILSLEDPIEQYQRFLKMVNGKDTNVSITLIK